MKLLLAHGANVNARNKKGHTALHMAMAYDYHEVCACREDGCENPYYPSELAGEYSFRRAVRRGALVAPRSGFTPLLLLFTRLPSPPFLATGAGGGRAGDWRR